MAEALVEARKAEGRTRPNPPVGCVIVRDGEVVARGYTQPAGSAHAEVSALRNWDGERPEDCTLYSTLEPCCTHGRTPPCTDAILRAGIGTVVVGVRDFIPGVDGKGMRILREAGVEVIESVLEPECRRVAMPFFRRVVASMPFVVAKWAMTLDGKVATRELDSKWITNEDSREFVHELRNRHDVIMIGKGTLLADDPRLNARVEGGRDPHRAVIDARLEISDDAAMLSLDSDAQTWIYCGSSADRARRERLQALDGVEVVDVPTDDAGRVDLRAVLRDIHDRGMLTVFVEGGGTLLGAFADGDLVDRVYGFVAPKLAGGSAARTPIEGTGIAQMRDALDLVDIEVRRFGDDVLIVGDRPGRQPWDEE